MTANIDKKRRRISAKADEEEEEKQKLRRPSISQSVNNEKNKMRRISSKEGTYLSNLLPHDIMLDVLSRLPVKSLMRFRSVSKSWNYLIRKDQFFINMHLSLQHEKWILPNLECNYHLYSLDYNQGSYRLERLIRHNSRLRHIHRDHNFIWGSCNGLICAGRTLRPFGLDLFISNPSTTEYRKIPYFESDVNNSCYGFGYNPNANDYVVLQLTAEGQRSKQQFLSTVAIYSLRNNSWKKIPNIPYEVRSLFQPGVLLYGSFHWVAHSKYIKSENRKKKYDREENAILAFEITTEKFVEVPCPDDHHGIMRMDQYQGKLCFYHDMEINSTSFDLWVMNEYKVRESWSKLFKIRQPSDYKIPISICVACSTKEGYILMESSVFENDHMILYDPKQKTRRNIVGLRAGGAVNYYVPSIVAFDFN